MARRKKPEKSNDPHMILSSFEDLLEKKKVGFDIESIASKLLDLYDGEIGIAKMIHDGQKLTVPGSLAHQRYCSLVMDILRLGHPDKENVDLGHLNEDDLRRVLRQELDNVSLGSKLNGY